MKNIEVKEIIKPIPASDGAGVKLKRSIGTPAINYLDPFLMLDEFGSENKDDYIGGFPPHPHRGIETVTYMLCGEFEHEDSTGAKGRMSAGDVQWMKTGGGIIHSEMPAMTEGKLHGFQLWVNMPAKLKIIKPSYQNIDPEEIPENYVELIDQYLDKNSTTEVKFDNDILHRSKVIKHFLDNNEKLSRTEKDFKSVYKKIKKNKKYFISIKDIVVLESLMADGISLPEDLDYTALSTQLTVPENLRDLVSQNQIGLVMLKIVEIIGEDNIRDLDPETIYFLNRILNELNLKKIRNNILSEALPIRV